MSAQHRSESEAMQIAKDFFGKKGSAPQLSVVPQQKLAAKMHSRALSGKSTAQPSNDGFYVVNDEANNRFVIVSADERMYKILGYSNKEAFDAEKIPDGLQDIMNGYNETYNHLKSTKGVTKTTQEESWIAVEPMIKTQWGQNYPYNAECPIDTNYRKYESMENIALALGMNIRGATGCIATAMAQVMNYYKYPSLGTGEVYYYTRSQNINQSMDFSEQAFDWNNMANTYIKGEYSDEQKEAVAKLMHACGNSVIMDYTSSGSGARNPDLAYALIHYFGYNPNIYYYPKKYYNSSEWSNMIRKELEEGRPIIYSGNGYIIQEDGSKSYGGHAYIVDGCDADGLFHINWGFDGDYNAYYKLEGSATDSLNFSSDQAMVCNITPNTLGRHEDTFFCSLFSQGDWLSDNTVGLFTTAELDTVCCYSVDANTYNAYFDGEIGIGLFDKDWHFIKSWASSDVYMKAHEYYSKKNFFLYYNPQTFTDGSKYNVAPYALRKDSKTPTIIWRSKGGINLGFTIEVTGDKVHVNLASIVDGIKSASINEPSISYSDGILNISASKTETIHIYSIDGVLVESINAKAGDDYQISIPEGIYVINGKKVNIKKK